MPDINPTRMNLIQLRRRIVVARKGYDILKRKREVLVIEFMKMLKQSKESRALLNELIQQSYKTVTIASTYVGNFELEDVAMHMKEAEPIQIRIKNIMGVRIPLINRMQRAPSMSYSVLPSSLAVDDISDSFVKVTNSIIDVAQREQGLKRLVIEIDKTKRRVNALDYRVIPRMRAQSKYIRMRLEEMDRDTFSALKHVKKKLATAHEA
ncbi:MAG: V-type ATP synthase subunit D [Candidatus Micrarchaeota archaeon]|nr:V-type ATP synthase subunit D [Candidatus Micrarchaeota archaeon]MDE1859315.1 V-type ATP synthase subunit D [Candidatus Micrarchaeota archaeon]